MKKPTPPTADDLAQYERLGGLLMTPNETARVMGRPDIEAHASELSVGATPAGLAWNRGRLLAECSIRESLLDLARQGSLPHAKEAIKLLAQCRESVEEAR